jgi:predicted XRE-type DNA-binding protein
MNTRALPQLIKMYELLQAQAKDILPVCSPELGNLVAVDCSLMTPFPLLCRHRPF